MLRRWRGCPLETPAQRRDVYAKQLSGEIGMHGEGRMERGATGHQQLNPLGAWPAPALIEQMSQTSLRFEREKLCVQKQQATAHGEFELAGMDG